MPIEKNYLDRIEEIKQNSDNLSEWEKGFVFGDEGDDENRPSLPIADRPQLSISQKAVIDRIYKEKVEGGDRVPVTEVQFENKRIIAIKTETNSFQVAVDDTQIGPEVSQREAVAVVGWLDVAIDALVPSPEAAKDKGFPGEE